MKSFTNDHQKNFYLKFSESQLIAIDVQKNQQFKEWIAKAIEERSSLDVSYFVCSAPKTNLPSKEQKSEEDPQNPSFYKLKLRFFFSVVSKVQPVGRVWNRDAMLPLFHSVFLDEGSLTNYIDRCINFAERFPDIRDSEEFKHFLRYQAFKLLPPFIEENCRLLVKRSFLLAFMNRLIEPNDPLLQHYQLILSGPLFRAEGAVATARRIREYVDQLIVVFHKRADKPTKAFLDHGELIMEELMGEMDKLFRILKEIKHKIYEHFELADLDKVLDSMIVGLWNGLIKLGYSRKEPTFLSQIRQRILLRIQKVEDLQKKKDTPSLPSSPFLDIDHDLSKSFFDSPESPSSNPNLKLSTLQNIKSLSTGISRLMSVHSALNLPFQVPEASPIRFFSVYSLESNECLIAGKGKLADKFHFHKYYRESLNVDKIAKNLRKKDKILKRTGPMIVSLIVLQMLKRQKIKVFLEDMMLDLGLGGKTSQIFFQSFSAKRRDLVQQNLRSESGEKPFSLPVLYQSKFKMESVFMSNNNAMELHGINGLSEKSNKTTVYSFNHFEKIGSDKAASDFSKFIQQLNWRGTMGETFAHLHVRDLASFSLESASFSRNTHFSFEDSRFYFLDFFFPSGNIQDSLEFLTELLSRLCIQFHPRFLPDSSQICLYKVRALSPECRPYLQELAELISISSPNSFPASTFESNTMNNAPLSSRDYPVNMNPIFGSTLHQKTKQIISNILSNNHSIVLDFASLKGKSACSLYISGIIEGGLRQTLHLNNYWKFLCNSYLMFRGFLDSKDRDLFNAALQLHPLNPLKLISKKVNSSFLQFDISNLIKWKFFRHESRGDSYVSKRLGVGAQGKVKSVFEFKSKVCNFHGLVQAVLIQEVRPNLSSHFPEREFEPTRQTNTMSTNKISNGK